MFFVPEVATRIKLAVAKRTFKIAFLAPGFGTLAVRSQTAVKIKVVGVEVIIFVGVVIIPAHLLFSYRAK